jgi:hypothetical protein
VFARRGENQCIVQRSPAVGASVALEARQKPCEDTGDEPSLSIRRYRAMRRPAFDDGRRLQSETPAFRTLRRCIVSTIIDAPPTPAVRSRSGSHERRRTEKLPCAVDKEERVPIEEKAGATLEDAELTNPGAASTRPP